MIRAKEVSPVEVVDAALARIERVNPPLNAYVTVAAEQARDAAKTAEQEVVRGGARGALHGVPFSAKDVTATKGIRTTSGSKIFEHNVPEEDALLVQRIRGAGAILLGKTNTPEFGCKPTTDNLVFGATHNPWALDRSPGGSSGGAAAAVAAGLGPWPRAGTSPGRSVTPPHGAALSDSSRPKAGSPATLTRPDGARCRRTDRSRGRSRTRPSCFR